MTPEYKSKYYGPPNIALQQLRGSRNLSQMELGEKLGYTRQYIARIECGISEGKKAFWLDVQTFFNIPDNLMWKIYKGEALS